MLLIPAIWNRSAMNRACLMLTQNPSARILLGVGDFLPYLVNDPVRPDVICRHDTRKGVNVVPATSPPRHIPQIEPVVDAVVVERSKVLLVNRVPESGAPPQCGLQSG